MLEVCLVMKRSNTFTFAYKGLQRLALGSFLCLSVSFAMAQSDDIHYGGDDTILIEKEVSTKIPYNKIAKAMIDHFFKVDVQSMFAGGKNLKTACVRNFSEYADRTKYRVGVKKDELHLKFSLNF